MATIHISQQEAERDISTLLAQLDTNTTFVIENGLGPVAVLRSARKLSMRERIDQLSNDTEAAMDDAFALDVEAGIAAHRDVLDLEIFKA